MKAGFDRVSFLGGVSGAFDSVANVILVFVGPLPEGYVLSGVRLMVIRDFAGLTRFGFFLCSWAPESFDNAQLGQALFRREVWTPFVAPGLPVRGQVNGVEVVEWSPGVFLGPGPRWLAVPLLSQTGLGEYNALLSAECTREW